MFGLGLRELLFLAGGVTAAAGAGAYVTGMLDPLLGRTPPAVVAALPDTPAPPQTLPPAAGATVPQPEPPAVTQEARPIVPSFDLVRVEPDGSLVVAGRAAPGARVELIAGEAVLAAATATTEGDFAIVLDQPLAPGDYQVTLRATSPDETVTVSLESAVISVPDRPDGQVLVLVDEPGAPSELLTVPDAPAEEDAAEETVQAPPAEKDVAEAPIEEATPPDETEIAALPPEQAEPAQTQPAVEPRVVVEAVEIEGDRIFVAGQADPLRFIRVYANEMLLGETRVSEIGRFLVEARRDLPVGEYTIRADLLDDNGLVLARAVVPFEREPGEAIAAVAPPLPEPEVAEEEEIVAAPEPVLEAPKEEIVTAPEPEQPEPAEEEIAAAPEPEQPEPAEEEVVAAPEPEQPEPAEEEIAAAPEPEQPEPAEEEIVAAPEPEQPEPAEEEIVAAPEPEQPEPAEEEVVAAPEPEQPESAEEEIAAAPEPEQPEAAAEEIAAAPEVTAPKLQRADGSVIIRRGDSLWRISRRVYGHGVRYSTIYLANQGQISDPHRIWPGQVFAVPHETPEGETADMGAIGDQAVAPSEERMSGQ